MATPLTDKSTPDAIRQRFDRHVDNFSNLEIGQRTAIDAPLMMELIAQAAVVSTPAIGSVLDIGCGAGNNTLRLRQQLENDIDITLVDLSQAMVDRAGARLREANGGRIATIAGDFRHVDLPEESFDVVLAAAVFHHLRDDADWHHAFTKVHRLLRPGGSVWISDLVDHDSLGVHELMWRRYGDYLVALDGPAFRDHVFAYIDEEDSPRSVLYQLDLLRAIGFARVELLHKNSCFAAFGAIKAG